MSVTSGSVFGVGTLRVVPQLLVKAAINPLYVFVGVF